MGAHPKKKLTRARQGARAAHRHLKAPSLTPCPQCHTAKLPHRACPNCGYYRGREVITVEANTRSQG